MGQAKYYQIDKKCVLKETIRHAKQKVSTNLETIATESTIDEKLIKTLVCLEKKQFYKCRSNTKSTHKNYLHALEWYFTMTEYSYQRHYELQLYCPFTRDLVASNEGYSEKITKWN